MVLMLFLASYRSIVHQGKIGACTRQGSIMHLYYIYTHIYLYQVAE
jgi:hypothetical protein